MMRRGLAVTLLCACSFVVSCGSHEEAEAPASVAPASVASTVRASAASRSIDDPKFGPELEDRIRAAQERLIEQWRFFDNFNPLGMTLSQIKDAQGLLKRVVPDFRTDMNHIADASEEYSAAYPDLASAPTPAVYMASRAWAYRFRFWSGLAVLDHTEHLLQELVNSGRCTPLDLMVLGGKLEAYKLSREGVLLFRRHMRAAAEALRRLSLAPSPQLAILLYDSRLLSLSWMPAQWPAPERAQMNEAIDGFLTATAKYPGPTGAAVATLEKDLWLPSRNTNSADTTVQTLTAVRDDFQRLRDLAPPAKNGLEYLRAQVDGEIKARQ
jgi:hypothetical protein